VERQQKGKLMQNDFAALIACIDELLEMFPVGQQPKVDQLRGNIEGLKIKYASGVAAWVQPAPIPPTP
jgi:hypothetical protein